MTIRNIFGGTAWINGEILTATALNDTFDAAGAGDVSMFLHTPISVGQGTWQFNVGTATNMMEGHEITNDTGGAADLDNATFNASMSEGTYTMFVIYNKSAGGAIADVDVDGTEATSFDTYTGTAANSLIDTTTAIAVTGNKIHSIRIRADGKNPASGDNIVSIQKIIFNRTA